MHHASNHEMISVMTTRSDVPLFDNTMRRYAEYWERAVLYSMKMKLDGKQKQTAVTLLGALTGLAWESPGDTQLSWRLAEAS